MSLPPLGVDDFARFFDAANGHPPFRWQVRMAREVMARGSWPEHVSLPTAAGKTSLIDIALFTLACQAHLPHAERRAPLRIFFVIDRRIVVDSAHQHAADVADLLRCALNDDHVPAVLRSVAQRLGHLAGPDSPPLFPSIMRGGMLLDASWTRSATQPTVCISTVDQFGSRLLFRGYGVTRNQRPIHAALTGCDSLVIVDEAHLSTPFCETLQRVKLYSRRGGKPIAKPLTLVKMTATPVGETESFHLEPQDFPEPELERRLSTSKPTTLESVADAENATARTALVTKALEYAAKMAQGQPKVIGIVVNRVLTARRIFEELNVSPEDKLLLIGRVRPLDRDRLWAAWKGRLSSDPKQRDPIKEHTFVVATQTIEVGADLDFDALITELAPIDSLRQRFGRLNRRGNRLTCAAVIIATKDQLAARYSDPVYDGTLAPTWKWLKEQEERQGRARLVNFSVNNISKRLDATPEEERKALTLDPKHAPVLLPAHLNAYAQTSTPPVPETDVSIFLHGPQPPEVDVRIIWRADLLGFPKDSDKELDDKQWKQVEAWPDVVGAARPSSLEAMSLPLPTAIRWLQQRSSVSLTDLASGGDAGPERDLKMRPAVAWRGSRECKLVKYPGQIRPGDTLIVPSTYGGADEFGWIGQRAASSEVPDLAEEAAFKRGRARILRLHPAVLASPEFPDQRERIKAFLENEDADVFVDLLPAITTAAEESGASIILRDLLKYFQNLPKRSRHSVRPDYYSGVILRDPWLLKNGAFLELDDDIEEASQTLAIPLEAHLRGTEATARKVAFAAGLRKELTDDYALAGFLHDLGKADPRFQVILHGQETLAYSAIAAGKLLAKSARRFDTRAESRRLRNLARYPEGARHETLSVALACAEKGRLATAHERDLVLHLVAAHHAWARPFLPAVQEADEDREEVDVRPLGCSFSGVADYDAGKIGSECPERFWSLSGRYGWWGLAWLEAIFRLSDYEESAVEEEKEEQLS